jgi:hypothetical protein
VRSAIAGAFRRAAGPLAWYYAVVVAVPVLNGRPLEGALLEHAAFALAVPALIVAAAGGALALAQGVADRFWHNRAREAPHAQRGLVQPVPRGSARGGRVRDAFGGASGRAPERAERAGPAGARLPRPLARELARPERPGRGRPDPA